MLGRLFLLYESISVDFNGLKKLNNIKQEDKNTSVLSELEWDKFYRIINTIVS